MAGLEVRWTRAALADLKSARDYICSERPEAAGRVIERVEKSLEALRRHSELGRAGRVDGTREFVIPGTPFLLAYRVHKGTLEILAFLHGARRWPEDF